MLSANPLSHRSIDMYTSRLLLSLLTVCTLGLTALQAQRNRPAVRPVTIGENLLPNPGLELPLPSAEATAPAIPEDFPKQFLPTSPRDVFFEDEEAEEGGIGGKLIDYGLEHNFDYSEEQMDRFKTFVEAYVQYLKSASSFTKSRVQGWWMYPAQNASSSNFFTRIIEAPYEGKAALRLSGVFSTSHQFYTNDPVAVRSKAKYLISYRYKGTFPQSVAKKMLFVRITWIPKEGKTLAFNGVALPGGDKSWIDNRDNTNKYAKEGFFNTLIGMDLRGKEGQWTEKYMVVEAPEHAAKATVEFVFDKNEGSSAFADYDLQIDDLAMKVIQGEEGEPDTPPVTFTTPLAPKQVAQRYTQREFTVEWTNDDAAVEAFEVELSVMRGRTVESTQTFTTQETRYAFEGMKPGTTYRIRLRSKKGQAFSDYSVPLYINTRRIGDFNGGTIPFLYTIAEDGSCPQKLSLYYVELENPEAKITYWIDGQEVQPEGKVLTFPTLGSHLLTITIEESAEKIWDLEYQVTVK